ncbi:MAG: hypothetical protein LBP99_08080 [Azoarcus sp.]|nr:hypothetical protein [Azoarcus sp.]
MDSNAAAAAGNNALVVDGTPVVAVGNTLAVVEKTSGGGTQTWHSTFSISSNNDSRRGRVGAASTIEDLKPAFIPFAHAGTALLHTVRDPV